MLPIHLELISSAVTKAGKESIALHRFGAKGWKPRVDVHKLNAMVSPQ
jgi:hypothetical protein